MQKSNFSKITLYCFLICIYACSSSKQTTSEFVSPVNRTEQLKSTDKVSATSYSTVPDGVVELDQSLATLEQYYDMLLFSGIPGSSSPRPLVPLENRPNVQKSTFYKKLLSGDYNNLLVVPDTSRLLINIFQLRSELEAQGLIKKFGIE